MSQLNLHELDFPADIWESFAANRPCVHCSAGYLIYLQDTEATCFYYLKSGRVKSYIQSEDGAQRVLNIYEKGALFGEASLMNCPGFLPLWHLLPAKSCPLTVNW